MSLQKVHSKKAFEFYLHHIINVKKQNLLAKYDFKVNGTVSSKDWELFAAILVNEKAKEGYGSDLANFEVKSATVGSGFEYQYHKNTGMDKLLGDLEVDHLFISYSKSYADIIVRFVNSDLLKVYFLSWKTALEENYKSGSGKQRFRKSIPFGYVRDNGETIFQIENSKLKK